MQYIGIAEMIDKLYQGRLLALPGGSDTFLPLCNMQYIVSFLIRTISFPETIAQEYVLLDPATPKCHRLVNLAAEHLGVSAPHLQIPKVLLEKLPEVLLGGSKSSSLSFLMKTIMSLKQKNGCEDGYRRPNQYQSLFFSLD